MTSSHFAWKPSAPLAEQLDITTLKHDFTKLTQEFDPRGFGVARYRLAWSAIELSLNAETGTEAAASYLGVGEELLKDLGTMATGVRGSSAILHAHIPLFEARRKQSGVRKAVATTRERLAAFGKEIVEPINPPSKVHIENLRKSALKHIAFYLAGSRKTTRPEVAISQIFYPRSSREKRQDQYNAYRLGYNDGETASIYRLDKLRIRDSILPEAQNNDALVVGGYKTHEVSTIHLAHTAIQSMDFLDLKPADHMRWLVQEGAGETLDERHTLVLDAITNGIEQTVAQ